MRNLGLDVGTKTIGVAISDKTGMLASPFGVIRFSDLIEALEEVVRIIKECNIEEVVIGLPKNMDNSEGFASERSIKFKNLLENVIPYKICLFDERLSTVEAEKILIERGRSRQKRRKEIDAVAATLILEAYLKKGKNNE